MSTKTCQTCGVTKPVDDFRKAPTRFGGDGRANSCRDCLAHARAARVAAAQAAEQSDTERPRGPHLVITHALGFSAELVDRDICITQGEGKQRQTVWISIGEFTELVRWVRHVASDPVSPPQPVEEPTP